LGFSTVAFNEDRLPFGVRVLNLKGRRIVLTGVSRGIGLICARALLREGAIVLGVARESERLNRVSSELSNLGEFVAVTADMGEIGAADKIARVVEDRWGALDVLVNNAAVMQWLRDFEAENPETLEETLKVNLLGPHRLILALLKYLRKGNDPRILNVSSGAGTFASLNADPSGASYKLSKYALNGLTLLYASMLRGIVAVNSMDPGWVKTDMGGPNAPGDPEAVSQLLLTILNKPSSDTGKFWYGEWELQF
jgi:NAD(P)-dependent dehydrogenase (short-subunit alcohol dehydrogenase family)